MAAGTEALRQARIARSFGGRSVLKPHVDTAILQRGKAAGEVHGGGGQGMRGLVGGAPQRESGDPAVTGVGYEHKPYIGPFDQGLTDSGKEQQATHGRLDQFFQAFGQAIQGGADERTAFQQATKANPSAIHDLLTHPDAVQHLQSVEGLMSFMHSGAQAAQKTQVKGADGKVYNVDLNPDGSISNPQDVGLPGTPQKPIKPDKNIILHTDQGDMSVSPDGKTVTPIQFGGRTLADVPKGAAGKPPVTAPSDVPGLGPQVTADTPKTNWTAANQKVLQAAPTVLNALSRMQQMSANLGLVKGPLAVAAGEYFGINGGGAQFKADRDLIQANAPLIMGSGYKAATQNFMEGIGTPSNAPSFIRLQAGQMINAIRDRTQQVADEETTGHQAKLPSTIANQLISVGVVPNGYQNSKTFDAMPPGEAAQWKMRYQPGALSNQDKAGLLLGAAHGQITDPALLQQVKQMRQQIGQQRAALQQQQGSSQAALAAQSQPAGLGTGQPNPGVGQVNPAAQQNNGDQQQTQQPPQGAEQQPSQGQQQNIQENQGSPDQNAPLVPGSALGGGVVPPGPQGTNNVNVPAGQPQPGMPGTNGQTPLPPANPLPLVSQNVTPGGQTPTPSTQPTLQAASPQANTQAATPLLPNAGGGGAANAAPGAQGEADALSLSQELQSQGAQ